LFDVFSECIQTGILIDAKNNIKDFSIRFIAFQICSRSPPAQRPFDATASHRLQFHKRGQLFICTHNETLSVASVIPARFTVHGAV